MRPLYLVIAVVALLVGFAIGALTSGDEESGSESSAVTRSEDSEARDTTKQTGGVTSAEEGGDGGTERAPESADDPRPEAPDDVIGDRPGAGGSEDPGP